MLFYFSQTPSAAPPWSRKICDEMEIPGIGTYSIRKIIAKLSSGVLCRACEALSVRSTQLQNPISYHLHSLLQIILSSMVLERKPWSRPMLQLPRLHQSYAGVTFQTNSLPPPNQFSVHKPLQPNLFADRRSLSLYFSTLSRIQSRLSTFCTHWLIQTFRGVFFFSITPWLRGPGNIYRRINPGKNRHHPFIIHGYVRTSLF